MNSTTSPVAIAHYVRTAFQVVENKSHSQIRFDPLDIMDAEGIDATAAHKAALARRTRFVNQMRKTLPGLKISCFTLTGQLRQYAGYGVEDGRTRNVYYADLSAQPV